MKEDFFKVGYTTYLSRKSKKFNWTSKLKRIVIKHKFIITISAIIVSCLIMNFWLIYKFLKILEMNPILW